MSWLSSKWVLLLASLPVAACTFPDVELGSIGGAATTSVTNGSTAFGGGGTGSVGGMATGGAGAVGNGAAGSEGGAGNTGAGGSGGCNDDCDVDCDGYPSEARCGGDDCDDFDGDVHPGQTNWFETSSVSGVFDYNCDGDDEREFDTVKCSGTVCPSAQNVFLALTNAEVACGVTATFGNCATLTCADAKDDKIMRCR